MKSEIMHTGDRFRVRCYYSPILVDRFGLVPGRQFHKDDKAWSFPAVRDCLLMVCDVLGYLPHMLPHSLREIAGKGPLAPAAEAEPDLGLIDGHEFLTEPFEHQGRNLARLKGYQRWLISDEQGTGKTHAICNRLKTMQVRAGRISANYFPVGWRALIVCPKSVFSSWTDELKRHAGLDCIVIQGTPEQKLRLIRSAWESPIKVTNYEALLNLGEELLLMQPTVVVFDEIHRIKNFTAQTSRVAQKLSAQAMYVWGLSGTPAPNGLEDWQGVLAAINPDLLPQKTKTAFEGVYCVKQRIGGDGPWSIVGYRNVHVLHTFIASVTSRVCKADCLDLPGKVFQTRTVRLDGEQARIYRDLKKDAVARLSVHGMLTVNNILTESLRLLQVVGGFVPDDDGKLHEIDRKAKVQALEDALDEAGDRQVVVWCAFVAEVEYLAGWLEENYGGGVAALTGDTPTKKRDTEIARFRDGAARFFVATAGAGGTGVNGLQVADTEIYYSRNFKLTDYLQSQDRLDRIGQKNQVNVIKLVAQGTVDARVEEALENKRSLQEMMLGRPEEML